METKQANESMALHLAKLVTGAIDYYRKRLQLQVNLNAICINEHVQLMCATTFPQETLPALVANVRKLLNQCNQLSPDPSIPGFGSSNQPDPSIDGLEIIPSLEQLLENLLSRQT